MERVNQEGEYCTEGRFGIGFKFWTYHFNTAKLEAENWCCEYTADLKNVRLESSNISEGMRLTFSNSKNNKTKEDMTPEEREEESRRKDLEEKLVRFCDDPK